LGSRIDDPGRGRVARGRALVGHVLHHLSLTVRLAEPRPGICRPT
jgi:hypothetical protein